MVLASRGLRELEGGIAPVEDDVERAQLRRQAGGVHVRSALLAVALTMIALALPELAG